MVKTLYREYYCAKTCVPNTVGKIQCCLTDNCNYDSSLQLRSFALLNTSKLATLITFLASKVFSDSLFN